MDWKKLLNDERLRPGTPRPEGDIRNDFESDFGRIIFSPAMRRMHDKTQVFPLTADDNIHSRLTHSMEVMSMGFSIGVKLCESQQFVERVGLSTYELFRRVPVLLKNSCSIHDIGNPPFGHFGETVIQNYFKDLFNNDELMSKYKIHLTPEQKSDFLHFDGNAQGLRVLTKTQILNDMFGLNLTYATLGSYVKYPNHEGVCEAPLEKTKKGVFQSELDYFNKIVDNCGLRVGENVIRHPLCYLMEAADSICYLTMDIEDGYSKGLFDIKYLYDIYKKIPSIEEKIEKIYVDKDKYYKNDLTKVVNFRITIIQQLLLLTVSNFEDNLNDIETGTYGKELIFDDKNQLAQALKDICGEKIFPFREITSLEITGHSVIKGLLDYYISFIYHEDKKYRKKAQSLISESIIRAAFEESVGEGDKPKIDGLNDYYKLRVVLDFITGMTDQFALNHYQKISGQKIS